MWIKNKDLRVNTDLVTGYFPTGRFRVGLILSRPEPLNYANVVQFNFNTEPERNTFLDDLDALLKVREP